MPIELKWSDPIKAAAVGEAVPDEPGVYKIFVKNPPIYLKAGQVKAGEPGGLRARIQADCEQVESKTGLAKYIDKDTEIGAVFNFDIHLPEHRKNFMSRDCYFQVAPMPGASDEEIDRAEKTLETDPPPRYLGEPGHCKGIEWV